MVLKIVDIEALRGRMNELPEIDDKERPVSKQEAVSLLANDIRGLQKKGYSLEKIATILADGGLEITVHTLKSYLTRARAVSGKKNSQRPKPTAAPRSAAQKDKEPSPTSTPAVDTKESTGKDKVRDEKRSSSFTPKTDTDDI